MIEAIETTSNPAVFKFVPRIFASRYLTFSILQDACLIVIVALAQENSTDQMFYMAYFAACIVATYVIYEGSPGSFSTSEITHQSETLKRVLKRLDSVSSENQYLYCLVHREAYPETYSTKSLDFCLTNGDFESTYRDKNADMKTITLNAIEHVKYHTEKRLLIVRDAFFVKCYTGIMISVIIIIGTPLRLMRILFLAWLFVCAMPLAYVI